MKNQYFCSQPSQLYLSHLAETKLLTTTQKQLIQLQQQKKLLLQKKLQQIQLLVTLQLLAVTLLRLNNSVRTLERIESLPCESATDFFYVFTPPFSANIPSFCNTNYLLLFLKPQTKTGYEKDKSKRNTSKLEVGKLFP